MKRGYPTISQLKLASECLYPWAEGVAWTGGGPGVPARVGSAVHACVEHLLTGSDYSEALVADQAFAHSVDISLVLPLLDRWRAWASAQERLLGGDVERAFAYDGRVVTALGTRLNRSYPPEAARAIVGTADLVTYGVGEGSGTGCVTDWKTSLGIDTSADPASKNHQLHALAALANVDRVRLVVITEAGVRVDEAPAMPRGHVISGLDALMQTIDAGGIEPRPGDQCKWCPARAGCPALAPAATAIVGSEAPRVDLTTGPGVALARAWLRRVEEAAKTLEDAVKDAVRAAGPSGLDLGNGKALKMSPRSRRNIAWTDEMKDAARAAGLETVSTFEVLTETKVKP